MERLEKRRFGEHARGGWYCLLRFSSVQMIIAAAYILVQQDWARGCMFCMYGTCTMTRGSSVNARGFQPTHAKVRNNRSGNATARLRWQADDGACLRKAISSVQMIHASLLVIAAYNFGAAGLGKRVRFCMTRGNSVNARGIKPTNAKMRNSRRGDATVRLHRLAEHQPLQ